RQVAHHIGGYNRGEATDSKHWSVGAFSSHTNLPSNSPNPHSDINRAHCLRAPAVVSGPRSEGARAVDASCPASDGFGVDLSRPVKTERMTADGASSPLLRTPVKVSLLNPQPALSLGGRNRCSC